MTAAATLVGFLQVLREHVNDCPNQAPPFAALSVWWKVTVVHRLRFELRSAPFAMPAALLSQTCPANCHGNDTLSAPRLKPHSHVGLTAQMNVFYFWMSRSAEIWYKFYLQKRGM